jgi:hypothetical protein
VGSSPIGVAWKIKYLQKMDTFAGNIALDLKVVTVQSATLKEEKKTK